MTAVDDDETLAGASESELSWGGPSVLTFAADLDAVSFVGPVAGTAPATRFERLELLGRGGMGEVWRVRDQDLDRIVAMKVLRADKGLERSRLERFVHEAQITAQLDHPGVVPVFELGRLDDGRLYYTMEEIRGRSFADALQEVHEVSTEQRWGRAETGWGFLELTAAFAQVCSTVAHAH